MGYYNKSFNSFIILCSTQSGPVSLCTYCVVSHGLHFISYAPLIGLPSPFFIFLFSISQSVPL